MWLQHRHGWTEDQLYGSGVERVEQLRWAFFAELLKRDATFDVEAARRSIADDWEDLRVSDSKDPNVRKVVIRQRIRRRESALTDAIAHRTKVRRALLLDDEEPDGKS